MDARELHADAIVVDTHNDLMLLVDFHDERLRRDTFQEYWLPQLRAGGVDVQVLPIWVEPRLQSEGGLRRTLLLIERVHELAEENSDDVSVCRTMFEVDVALKEGKIALIIALEGAHGIGQDPCLIRSMDRVGVRIVSIAHLGRTFLADGSGLDDSSASRLTPEGLSVFKEMERRGIVFDVSHLGLGGVEDVIELATRPFLATHSACNTITESHRNLGDDHIKRIASLGGVISVAAAIPPFIDPICPTAERVIDHVEHIISVGGIDSVGIGPDFIDDYYQQVLGGWPKFPGITQEFNPAEIARPSDLPKLTEVMARRGFQEADIRKVLGENVLRVLRQVMGVPA
ncbi:MAG TPA: membrane dipeptidase [Acidimicrobiales bacterium]|nr:membrane dipeptidase [Acidimicrobiales bacterium]